MPRPMTLVASMLLLIAVGAVLWLYADPTGVRETRIILLLWAIGAVLAGVSAGPGSLGHRRMAHYSRSFGPKDADEQAVAKDLRSSRVVIFLVAAFSVVAGIVGFFIA